MSVEEQHVNGRGFGEGQEKKRAGQSKREEAHPLPRQQEHTRETGAYNLIHHASRTYVAFSHVIKYFEVHSM